MNLTVAPAEAAGAALPAVIAHRGASGHRPEHTLAGYQLAFELGADSIELDLVATADGVLVCRHDVELSRTTDVADRPEFADRRRTLLVGRRPVSGWFVHDFDFAELRTLRCRERWQRKRADSAAHDGAWRVPAFTEVIDLVAAESARLGRRLGIHAELKSAGHLAVNGLWLPELLSAHLAGRGPVPAGVDLTWMSFEGHALRAVDLPGPKVRLHSGLPGRRSLAVAAEYFDAIGVRRRVVLPRDRRGRIGAPSGLVERAHELGLGVLVWTHRAENQHLPANLRHGIGNHDHGDAVGEARRFFAAGVDGLISDFPELAAQARTEYRTDLLAGSTAAG